MSWHPLIPWPFVVVIGLVLVGFTGWRLVADSRWRVRWALRCAAAVAMLVALLGPATPGGKPLLRMSVSAALTPEQIDGALAAIIRTAHALGQLGTPLAAE